MNRLHARAKSEQAPWAELRVNRLHAELRVNRLLGVEHKRLINVTQVVEATNGVFECSMSLACDGKTNIHLDKKDFSNK